MIDYRISALFYKSLIVLIVIPNKPLGEVRNLIALHCIALWDLSPFASLGASTVRDDSAFHWT